MICVFTTGLDTLENVLVVVQVGIEDEHHGELSEDKTQLRMKKERGGDSTSVHNVTVNHALVNKIWLKTHIEDAVEDRLEDDDVSVARSLRKLLLLLHMLLLVVDVLIVLLCHPACVCG